LLVAQLAHQRQKRQCRFLFTVPVEGRSLAKARLGGLWAHSRGLSAARRSGMGL
jgi:hypothetical protein